MEHLSGMLQETFPLLLCNHPSYRLGKKRRLQWLARLLHQCATCCKVFIITYTLIYKTMITNNTRQFPLSCFSASGVSRVLTKRQDDAQKSCESFYPFVQTHPIDTCSISIFSSSSANGETIPNSVISSRVSDHLSSSSCSHFIPRS